MAIPPVPNALEPPATEGANAAPNETLEERFRRLERIWREETGHLSSYTKRYNHPAFQEIIRLGKAVVPLMLRDLQERPRLWVWVLPDITGENPVAAEDVGHIERMSNAWLSWAREKGYQW